MVKPLDVVRSLLSSGLTRKVQAHLIVGIQYMMVGVSWYVFRYWRRCPKSADIDFSGHSDSHNLDDRSRGVSGPCYGSATDADSGHRRLDGCFRILESNAWVSKCFFPTVPSGPDWR